MCVDLSFTYQMVDSAVRTSSLQMTYMQRKMCTFGSNSAIIYIKINTIHLACTIVIGSGYSLYIKQRLFPILRKIMDTNIISNVKISQKMCTFRFYILFGTHLLYDISLFNCWGIT